MMKKWKIILLIFALSVACKKPYNPKVINSPKSYLIVEGIINTNDTTIIKLSRSVNLSSKVTNNPVEGTVNVESDAGDSYPLTSAGNGVYKLIDTKLNNSRKYRLFIHTNDNGNEYRSDFGDVKNAPPIDSVGYITNAAGISLYLNTRDVTNNTRYYRVEYWETWAFSAKYTSQWISNGVSDVIMRPYNQQITYCFQSHISSSVILASTAKLSQDVLYQLPLFDISATSEKLESKYSILVRQYSLTAEAYKFWESLKKNTEQLGSIFDAEPTQLIGNIHNIHDNTDVVIGYISVGAVATKRIFIMNTELPFNFIATYPYDCQLDTALYLDRRSMGQNTVFSKLVKGNELPVSALYTPGNPKPIGYTASSIYCVDCTIRGTTKQPEFWK